MKQKLLFVILFSFFGLVSCNSAQTIAHPPVSVYYAGPEDGVKTALDLANQAKTVELIADPAQAEVLVLNGEIPDPQGAVSHLLAGKGAVIIMGPEITEDEAAALLGPVTLTYLDQPVSLIDIKGINDPLTSEIIWNGAPQIRARYAVITPLSSVQPLVTTYENGEWVLWMSAGGNVFIFDGFLGDENPQIQEWAYFNYLVYHLAARAGGVTPLPFADYPASPVPHAVDRNVIFIFLGVMLVVTCGIFLFIRRYSRQHPEALDALVANQENFEKREANTAWEQIGFHRPLSGLLVGMALGVVLFIPLIIYQNLILPQFILPSAQAMGIWGRVTQFFQLTWVVFDLGTAVASAKFFSQYRVDDPRRAMKYLQVFVWWQALSGAIQVAIVMVVASTGVVRSPYALYTWSIVIHSLIQIPGFYTVTRNALNAMQRNDYARYMDTIYAIVMPMITQPLLVPLFYWWGKHHPEIGGPLGGVLGMGVAAYVLELSMFLIGLYLYKRLGYKASVIFMAHFDGAIIRETFRFGVFEMLGGMLAAGGLAAEIWITQTRLVNYTEVWGNWVLAQNFVFAFTVGTNLTDGILPAISEAVSHGRKLLSQYYGVMSYKWGAIASAFLSAVLLAVAPKFIIGSSGVEFQRAAIYVVPLVIWGSIQFAAWLSDAIFLGSNRPVMRALMIFGESLLRVLLALILLERFQIVALIIAYLVAMLARAILGYFIADKVCFPQRFFAWQSLAAPILATVAHYLFLSLLAQFIWQGEEISSIILFFVGILPSLPVFLFFYALFGGWDDQTLDEFEQASQLTGFLRSILRFLFILPSRWGARLSPLHNRFPITIRAAALEEAKSLTAEKVNLLNLHTAEEIN